MPISSLNVVWFSSNQEHHLFFIASPLLQKPEPRAIILLAHMVGWSLLLVHSLLNGKWAWALRSRVTMWNSAVRPMHKGSEWQLKQSWTLLSKLKVFALPVPSQRWHLSLICSLEDDAFLNSHKSLYNPVASLFFHIPHPCGQLDTWILASYLTQEFSR